MLQLSREATVLRNWAAGLAPDAIVSSRDWIANNLVVADGPRAGQLFDFNLTPYLVGILEALDDEAVNVVVVRKSAQVAFTTVAIGWVCANIDIAPAHDMIIQPTVDTARDFNRKKLQPAIDASPALQRKVRRQVSRSSDGSTALVKAFPGGSLTITGANSAADLRSKTTKRQVRDEIDEYPLDLDRQGDPEEMMDARLIAFHATGEWKVLKGSTPTIKGASRIDAAFEDSDQRKWHVRCPQCKQEQVLEFGDSSVRHGLKFKRQYPHEAHYVCLHGCIIEHHQKAAMVRGGRWVAMNPGPGRVPGFHIDALISLLTTWDELVNAFLRAKDDPQKLKGFVNLWLGQSWEERGDAPDWSRLLLRREGYAARSIPPGGLIHVLGADIQMNGIYYEVVTFGVDRQSWSVDAGFLVGDTSDIDRPVWKEFAAVLERRYPDAYGREWPIDLAGVDSGFNTNVVYQFCRGRPRVRATKGDDGWHKPAIATAPTKQQITFKGKRRGVHLWHIGTWPLKAALYQDLRKQGLKDGAEAAPAGYCHFSEHVNDEAYFKQLSAEYLKQEERAGRLRHRWVETGPNHYLDCRIIARAMAEAIGLSRLTADQWAEIAADRGAALPAQPDLLDVAIRPATTSEKGSQPGTVSPNNRPRYAKRKMGVR